MNRYVLSFYKKGNMRFISHLDLQRMFKRIINRSRIDIAYTEGFNPHTRTNIVQPLSLGFESEREFFEFETNTPADMQDVIGKFNAALPEGIRCTAIREIAPNKKNLSAFTEFAEYLVFVPAKDLDIDAFLQQDSVIILKRDKKTKKMVEKDVKSFVYEIKPVSEPEDGLLLFMRLRCASNETLNPLQLAESLLKFCGKAYIPEDIRITRTDICYYDNGIAKSIFEW